MKILLIDHHELFRDGLRHVLSKLHGGMGELLEAGDWMAGLKCIEQQPDLDLILLELKTPGCGGVESVEFLRKRYPNIPLVVLSGDENFQIIDKVLSYGASGFVGKTAPEPMLLGALNAVFEGNVYVPPQMIEYRLSFKGYHLTPRQEQILGCLSEGLTNREIAQRFDLTEGTIKVHVAAVYQALRVKSRREAANIADRMGLGTRQINESRWSGMHAGQAGQYKSRDREIIRGCNG
jgi:DNA-binding NarL/FixJ family response regulator